MSSDIPEEYLNELKEAFVHFDKDSDGFIQTGDLGTVFKYLNQSPTEEELALMIAEVDPDGNNQLDFATFVLLMKKNMKDDDTYEELLESFKVFDTEGTGQISIPELRYILTMLGDKMTNEEVDDIIKDVDGDSSGFMKYDEFVKEKLEKMKK